MTKSEFLARISIAATNDMKKSGILASLSIAQAILESGWGNSGLTQKGCNLYGIKGDYNGNYITMLTTEYKNGVAYKVEAKFRKYESWHQSVQDHSALFNRLDRYKNLRGCKDYKLACRYVYEDGYATDPEYTNKLISIIESNNLTKYDTAEKYVNYTIKKGDTLIGIGNKFNIDYKYIAKYNNIKNVNRIYAGNVIKIPC